MRTCVPCKGPIKRDHHQPPPHSERHVSKRRHVKLLVDLTDKEMSPLTEGLRNKLRDGLIEVLDGHLWPDDLERIHDAIEGAEKYMEASVRQARDRAVISDIADLRSNIAEIDSESTLKDQIKALQRYAPKVGIDEAALKSAIQTIEVRISEINDETDEAPSIKASGQPAQKSDKFDDAELSSLFAPLVAG